MTELHSILYQHHKYGTYGLDTTLIREYVRAVGTPRNEHLSDILQMAEDLLGYALHLAVQESSQEFVNAADDVYQRFTLLRRLLRTPWRLLPSDVKEKFDALLMALEAREDAGETRR